jgi:hypothetical protein
MKSQVFSDSKSLFQSFYIRIVEMYLDDLLKQNNIRNFTSSELSKCGEPPMNLIQNIIPTVSLLQSIRDYIGVPIIVHSGYIDENYNRKVGGKTHSLHISFNAIDFSPKGYNHYALEQLRDDIEDNKFSTVIKWNDKLINITPEIMGIGLYKEFIHIDTRGLLQLKAPARWHG